MAIEDFIGGIRAEISAAVESGDTVRAKAARVALASLTEDTAPETTVKAGVPERATKKTAASRSQETGQV